MNKKTNVKFRNYFRTTYIFKNYDFIVEKKNVNITELYSYNLYNNIMLILFYRFVIQRAIILFFDKTRNSMESYFFTEARTN